MDLDLQAELVGVADLRRRIRHLGAFRESFRRCADLMAETRGIRFDISDRRLAAAFLDWAELFEREKPMAREAPRDFVAFAGGLLARELLRQKFGDMVPVSAPAPRASAANDNCIASFWPAGFLVMSYCASVVNSVAIQDFCAPFALEPAARDLRVWWSFRDDVRNDPSCIIGYLDLFFGNAPQWTKPDLFVERLKHRETGGSP